MRNSWHIKEIDSRKQSKAESGVNFIGTLYIEQECVTFCYPIQGRRELVTRCCLLVWVASLHSTISHPLCVCAAYLLRLL